MADSNALSEKQRADFHSVLEKFGVNPGTVAGKTLDTADFGGNLVISSESYDSSVPPTLVPFASMAELKWLIGVPDKNFESGGQSDAFTYYPPALAPDRAAFLRDSKNICDLRYHLTADEMNTLKQAAYAYVGGHSKKVSDYEDMLNAHFAPGAVAFVAADSIVVQNGQTLTIPPSSTPVVVNAGSITVIGTGQIVINDCPVTMITQTFDVQSQ